MQLIKLNFFGGLDRVIDADGNGDEQETNMAFPDGSHKQFS
jgi:hypothetical protein